MQFDNVRLASVTVDNLKNVVHGELTLNGSDDCMQASILGLFGQNGSGKTALIRALAILKSLLTRMPLEPGLAESIQVDAESARLLFEFHLFEKKSGHVAADVWYEVVLEKQSNGQSGQLLSAPSVPDQSPKAVILSERMWVSGLTSAGSRKTLWLDTDSTEWPFQPQVKYRHLIGTASAEKNALAVAKALAKERGLSFIFSGELSNVLLKKATDENVDARELTAVVQRLMRFGYSEFFVIAAAESALVNLNALPLQMKAEAVDGHPGLAGGVLLPLNGIGVLPSTLVPTVKAGLTQLNVVLEQLVPGLTIEMAEISREFGASGEAITKFQLMSHKNRRAIPLQYESDGIKKIIAVLHLIICVYNERTVTVAIDELDSGIFEYLLGELLKILAQGGRGQLIFTSHNLRALETLDKRFVAFTTVNPENRYVRIKNIKGTNNLRDVYYRNLILGGDDVNRLYNPTNNGRIALAMREAGQRHG